MKYGNVPGSLSRGRLMIICCYMVLYNQDGRRALWFGKDNIGLRV